MVQYMKFDQKTGKGKQEYCTVILPGRPEKESKKKGMVGKTQQNQTHYDSSDSEDD